MVLKRDAEARIVLTEALIPLPAIVRDCIEKASRGFIMEFFTASIRNRSTRAAYSRAVKQFRDWCEDLRRELYEIDPLTVAGYVEQLGSRTAKPTVNQDLAAARVAPDATTRCGGPEYRATAQWRADRLLRRPKAAKLAQNEVLRCYVHDRLQAWSLRLMEERSGFLRCRGKHADRDAGSTGSGRWRGARNRLLRRVPFDFPAGDSMRISHEAIYQALYAQGRGALRRELTSSLRTGRALRMPLAQLHGKGKSFVVPERS
jgi:hypothetical protein